MSSNIRRAVVLVTAAVALVGIAGTSGGQERARPRTLVLGFDGASADRVEQLMGDGKLPNLLKLATHGGYSRFTTANPAQSPVSWATITTGWNPGKTGIYDFLRRKPATNGSNISIDFAHAETVSRAVVPESARAALVGLAGLVGAAAGVGAIFALYAGARRAIRPHGLMQGTMTGAAFLFAAVGYVALGWVPAKVNYARNLRSGEPFWVTLDKNGVRCIVLEAPLSFPADEMHEGCCLSGLGTPDLQASWGWFATWTDDPELPAKTETGGTTYMIEPGTKSFDLVLPGPPNPTPDPAAIHEATQAADRESHMRELAFDWTPERRRASETKEALLRNRDRLAAHVTATIDPGKGCRLATAEGVGVDLAPGVWSDLVPVVLPVSRLMKVHGRVRFLLQSAGSAPTAGGRAWTPFRLFVSALQFDAEKLPPNAQIASPMEFAADLAHANGPFETLGWPELTSAVKDDVVSDREFVAHIDILRRSREKRLMERLGRDDWDCLFAMFSEPDRVQHALYRHIDPKSPRHDPKAAQELVDTDRPLAGEIDRSYVEMDRLVGQVMSVLKPPTTILVCSDHGFAPFRRGVNLNNFLCSQGFQVRAGRAVPGKVDDLVGGKFFENVNWAETKAYGMGLGNLYLNLEGREVRGSVKPADAEKVLSDIETRLLALTDKDGAKVVRHVYRGRDLYHGARASEAPDLVVGFEWGYRVSWQNALGSCDAEVITDNTFRWSGDHCSVDPELVPGVLFSSLPLEGTRAPNVVDFAPSILAIYGLKGPDPDGTPFFAKE